MKKLIALILVLNLFSLLGATPQQPDYLYFRGKKLILNTGWGHPSPLETYYSQNNINYPFTGYSTGNYRGHIATWEVKHGRLFLKELSVRDKKEKPSKYQIKSKIDSLSTDDEVFADWFSGVIECEYRKKNSWEAQESYYFYVRNGQVVTFQVLTKNDFKKINNLSEKDTSNQDLMDKYAMLFMNQNYIAYYFRLHDKDTIIVEDKGGYLSGNSGLSPILLFYENDHTKWPYNWENFDKTGAPNCTWSIRNDSLVLQQLNLHSGTGFYEIDKLTIDLSEMFGEKVINNVVFADWVSGIYIISYGKEEEDEMLTGYKSFKPSEYLILRIDSGKVIEKQILLGDFNFREIPKDINPGLKKMLDEMKK